VENLLSKNTYATKDLLDQLPKNLIANLVYFLVSIGIGLFLVPYFVSNLGIAVYGLIPLMTSLTGYAAIVIQSINISVSRFLTVDLQREDYVAANLTFNTAFFGLTTAILLMLPVVIAVAWFVPSVFYIPDGHDADTIILFLGVCAAFLLRTWSGNFTVQLFAYNRLDLQNLVNLVNLIVQTGLVFLLFSVFSPNLALIGMAYLAGAVIASGISIIFSRRVCPYLRISIEAFDRTRIKDLCKMGWWVIINNVGSLLFLQIDLILVNLLFGATSAGEYAIAIQWAFLIRGFAGVLSGVLAPTIFSYYARGQTTSLIWTTKSAVKLMGLAIALPIGLICGFAPQLLTVWVGSQFIALAPLMVLMTVHLSINLAVLPIFSINVAHNKVRIPGIVTLVMGIGNVALAIALSQLTSWNYYGVALAGAIVLTAKNAFFTPWYATKVLGVEVYTFSRSMLHGVAATIMVGISAATLCAFLRIASLDMLAIAGTFVSLIYLAVVWGFGLSSVERSLFESYLPSAFRRISK
jgi:O-antigen/teichoic acid export membrane protein